MENFTWTLTKSDYLEVQTKLCSASTSNIHVKTMASEKGKKSEYALFYILKKNMKWKDELKQINKVVN